MKSRYNIKIDFPEATEHQVSVFESQLKKLDSLHPHTERYNVRSSARRMWRETNEFVDKGIEYKAVVSEPDSCEGCAFVKKHGDCSRESYISCSGDSEDAATGDTRIDGRHVIWKVVEKPTTKVVTDNNLFGSWS